MDKQTAYENLKTRFMGQFYTEQCPPVFGEGCLNPSIVIIGEAPGEQETLQGHPFVGKAGQNLNEFLNTLALAREDIYITNIVKVRPTQCKKGSKRLSNRTPNSAEIEAHRPFLLEELALLRPEIIVTLGNTPLQGLTMDKKMVIGDVHGTLQEIALPLGKIKLFALYHPASLIYNRSLKQVYERDLQALAGLIR